MSIANKHMAKSEQHSYLPEES